MLIDMHAHSKGISRCSKADGKDVCLISKEYGMDGMILCNHYDFSYLVNNDPYEFASRYINEYFYVKEFGDSINFKVYFGIEITMKKYNNLHMLVYGVTTDFVLKYPCMYDFSIEELSKIVHENNGILVQPHPLRKGKNVLMDLKYLDGVEANCHPKYDGTYIDLFSKIAKENKMLLTCGGDYHADTHRPKCGIYLPDNLEDTLDIVRYLVSSNEIKLCIQEVNDFNSYDYVFIK